MPKHPVLRLKFLMEGRPLGGGIFFALFGAVCEYLINI
jgi:hypothetical protein